MLINRVAMPKSPEALLDRADEALERLGYGQDVGNSARGVGFSLDYARYLAETSNDRHRWDRLAGSRPEAFYLWRRTSPRTIVPFSDSGGVLPFDPPMTVGGMTLTAVDAFGRLGQFIAVPAPNEPSRGDARPLDWRVLFDAAGLPFDAFRPTEPRIVPPVYGDTRMAWDGHVPEQPDLPLHIEAGALGGRTNYFVVTGDWSRSSSREGPRNRP